MTNELELTEEEKKHVDPRLAESIQSLMKSVEELRVMHQVNVLPPEKLDMIKKNAARFDSEYTLMQASAKRDLDEIIKEGDMEKYGKYVIEFQLKRSDLMIKHQNIDKDIIRSPL